MSGQPATTDVHQALVDFADSGRAFALAVILKDTGSTPRKAGTKALIDASGAIWGTIGGGAVEAETQRRAVEAIRSRRPLVFDFALEGSRAGDAEPLCGGSMRILIDPTAADHRTVYAQAAGSRCRDPARPGKPAALGARRGVLVTSVFIESVTRTAVQWFAEESLAGVGAPAACADGFPGGQVMREALAQETPQLVVRERPEGGHSEVLIEPLVPPPLLVIAGGGHVGQALAVQADLVGFDIVVIDDRREFLDAALYPPGAVTRCGDIAEELAGFPVAGDTFIAIVTRGHQVDRQALAACLRRPAAYVGMIGSRRKVALLRKDLLESGAATEEEVGRVYAPIGLDIGAQTVPEIAASIVAQLIAVRRYGRAPRMPIE